MTMQPIQPTDPTDALLAAWESTTAMPGAARVSLQAGAAALGISQASFGVALKQGASVPQLAELSGTTPDAVKNAMNTSLSEKLDAGIISQRQYNALQQLAAQLAAGKLTYAQYMLKVSEVN